MMVDRQTCANAIRILSVDAVQKAKSGHPGMPMGMADIAEVLWRDFLQHNPENPHWINRDRFVLSNGHGSMLLYALLHLSGYDLSLEDLKNFRQLHSKTPGHPEYGYAPGIETTTGPLGQGISNAVGMALAEKLLATQFNRDHFELIAHYTYCFLGDGCLMEGISHEACSLAGTLKLNKLIAFWDDNNISIDGDVSGWFTDNTPQRFESYGWQVVADVNGHDPEAIKQAIIQAQQNATQPTLICCKTIIGFGSPNLAGSAKTHGSPLGDEEIVAVRQQLNWPDAPFVIPETIYSAWNASTKGIMLETQWDDLFANYSQQHPELAMELTRRCAGDLPNDWADFCQQMITDIIKLNKAMATRQATTVCLDQLSLKLPELLGGSADLSGSNGTQSKHAKAITAHQANGNYLHYGVREFGMSAIMNGIILHGGFIPFGGTFLTFSDYARNAVRMAALMRIPTIFVYSHDSIGLGGDGPTHQAIEHTPSLRLIPNLHVWRPCDAVETAIAWQQAIEQTETPSCILLTRQTVAEQKRGEQILENIKRGAYILHDCHGEPEIILIATGSEVELAMDAAKLHFDQRIRVVSMPCVEVFEQQSNDYQKIVLPPTVTKRIAIEAAHSDYWMKYVGWSGKVLGIKQFGESAPADQLWAAFDFTLEHVSKLITELAD